MKYSVFWLTACNNFRVKDEIFKFKLWNGYKFDLVFSKIKSKIKGMFLTNVLNLLRKRHIYRLKFNIFLKKIEKFFNIK